MRIVIDMQGAQAENRKRGIGRYTLSLALAMVRNKGPHDIALAVNGSFPESVDQIRSAFHGILEPRSIHVWQGVTPSAFLSSENTWRWRSSELLRESFFASLKPDVLHVSSLFEGLVDDAVTSVGIKSRRYPIAITLYDLIPYIYRSHYLQNPIVESWYLKKIKQLKQADLWLAISESSRNEGITHLSLPQEHCLNVSADADPHFTRLELSDPQKRDIRNKYNLTKPFVMYGGGIDHRKNIDRLIISYAKLPPEVRNDHQLAIVCSVQSDARDHIQKLASSAGLETNEVILTGYVPEEDLVSLYNICSLFVFPSWHEGFGLPVLEAMRCGAPVIGANTSSVPEVIGMPEALFDPLSEEAIMQMLYKALLDKSFQDRLREHGKKQAHKFSWDHSAQLAIAGMERIVSDREPARWGQPRATKPRLAYISPMSPTKSGISYYSAELIPELANFYDVDVVTLAVGNAETSAFSNIHHRSCEWFRNNSTAYDRILYHFGNSEAHQHMFGLLDECPGVVVLHDFFLSGIKQHMDVFGHTPDCWSKELYLAHGYSAFRERFHSNDSADVVWKYPCSLSVLRSAVGVIAHSNHSIKLAKQWYNDSIDKWAVIPHLRNLPRVPNRDKLRKQLGLSREDFIACSFGMVGANKLSKELLEAWIQSDLSKARNCRLFFVGENCPGLYGAELNDRIRKAGIGDRVKITGWTDADTFQAFLGCADLAVQLRTLSRGETSGAVLDCMSFGLPTIVNAHGSMADLDPSAVCMLRDRFQLEELASAMREIRSSPPRCKALSKAARYTIAEKHNPAVCAAMYRDAIETFYESAELGVDGVVNSISKIGASSPCNKEILQVATSLASNLPETPRQQTIFVDISELVQRDAGSGIQRVVRNILKQWLSGSAAFVDGVRIEPVYASMGNGYRYARRFTSALLGCPDGLLPDEPISFVPGDVFLGLDLQRQIVCANAEFYRNLQRIGVRVVFVVYDLLCVRMPQFFLPGAKEDFEPWLKNVTQADRLVCISKAVADDLQQWIDENQRDASATCEIKWFHLGADIETENAQEQAAEEISGALAKALMGVSFLMVGTIEPRKGHAQVVDAFDLLWRQGFDGNLIIVGQQGWMVEEVILKMLEHPQHGNKLFWIQRASDEMLANLYGRCSCLIAASYGEGFGLPLIEAAKKSLPILARDIAVFQEVAGGSAEFFKAKSSEELAHAVNKWVNAYVKGQHIKSSNVNFLTWQQSAKVLLSHINPKQLDISDTRRK